MEEEEEENLNYSSQPIDLEKRRLLRQVEVQVLAYQDELETGKRGVRPGQSVAEMVEGFRRKLLSGESGRGERKRERRRRVGQSFVNYSITNKIKLQAQEESQNSDDNNGDTNGRDTDRHSRRRRNSSSSSSPRYNRLLLYFSYLIFHPPCLIKPSKS